MRFPRWRLATWALITWSAGILIWLVVGLWARGCEDDGSDIAQTFCEIGTGVGIGVILVIGVMGFVVLSLVWSMSRGTLRQCPVYGNAVARGVVVFSTCGYDFAATDDAVARTGEEG